MKKTAFAWSAAGVLSLSAILAGCSTQQTPNSGGAARTAAQPVTVVVGFVGTEISPQEIKDFNKSHKDVQIKYVDVSAQGKLQAMLASGNAPDIIRVQAASELPSYVIKGIALDLEPYFKKSTNVFPPSQFMPVINEYRFDGKTQGVGDLYGFVKDWSQDFTLWFNKAAFKKAGVPLPSTTTPLTWEQLMTLSKKLTIVKNGKVQQYGLGYYNSGTQAEYSLILLQLAQLGLTPWKDGFKQANFESPQAQKVLQMWVDAVKGNYGPNGLNKDPNWSGNLFDSNKAAIEISGYWYSGLLRGAVKKPADLNNFVMAPAPVMAGGKRMDPTGAAVGGIIYSKTKHPDQAWEVFEYLFGNKSEPATDRATSGWGLPGYQNMVNDLPSKTPFDKQVLGVQKAEFKYASPFLQYNPWVDLTAVNTVLTKYLTPVYYGRDTVANAVRHIDQDLNTLIMSGMQAAGVSN